MHTPRIAALLTGSVDDETATFSQEHDFRLIISDHHIQKGPSFPHPTEFVKKRLPFSRYWGGKETYSTQGGKKHSGIFQRTLGALKATGEESLAKGTLFTR